MALKHLCEQCGRPATMAFSESFTWPGANGYMQALPCAHHFRCALHSVPAAPEPRRLASDPFAVADDDTAVTAGRIHSLMIDPMNTIHSVKTIGPVRLELLPDGQYLIHLPPPSMVDNTQPSGRENGDVLAMQAVDCNDGDASTDEPIDF